jgi:hypothetical protein
MKKTLAHSLVAGGFFAAAVPLASPAMAQAVACGIYHPGLIVLLAPVHPAPCAYQGDRIAEQGPIYDGPAIIAPQRTYSPSPTVGGYVHGPYRVSSAHVVRRAPVSRVRRVSVKNELSDGQGKDKVEIVKARGEVRIYGSERMEIRLYRQ